MQKEKVAKALLVVLALLNIIDAVSTLLAINTGYAAEANPFMRFFINISPIAFLVAKLVFGPLFCTIYWRALLLMKVPTTMVATIVILVLFYAITLTFHGWFWYWYLNDSNHWYIVSEV